MEFSNLQTEEIDKIKNLFVNLNLENKKKVIETLTSCYTLDLAILNEQKIIKNTNNLGIEIYDNFISKDFCYELINLIDTLGNYYEISIKKCIEFTLFDLEFWKYYEKLKGNASHNTYAKQRKMNIKYNHIFLKLKEILYDKITIYCEKYQYFTKNLTFLTDRTGDLKNDILNNTDIVSIEFVKYEPNIHDCNKWHSENTFLSIDESTRKLVFIVYLNDVNNGGETEFYFQDLKIKPKIGRLSLFSPDWQCTHKGNVSADNPKYILTGWLHSKICLNHLVLPFYKLKYTPVLSFTNWLEEY